MPEAIDTNAKALKINLDPAIYGAFAEIGAGQEVSAWFFRVGGAAGTVAKTMSAYDMAVSDAIYGAGERYVSRERLRSMLEREYALLVERLGAKRGDTSSFFAFADTVATRSFKGGNECHGWTGLRFQHRPGAEPSDILLHVALLDPTARQQQQTLGVLGVNLLFAAYYMRESLAGMLASLMDGLSLQNLEIDVVDCSGPAFADGADQRSIAVGMLSRGLTHAVVFDESGRMEQPSTVFRKRGMLVHRCSLKRDNPELDAMMRGSAALLAAEGKAPERGPLPVLELCVAMPTGAQAGSADAVASAVDRVFRPGSATVLTDLPETFRLSAFLRRSSPDPIRFVVGLDAVVTILRDRFYAEVSGGLLEGLGKLLTPNTRLYVFSMPASVLKERLALHGVEPSFWSAADKATIGLDDLTVSPPAGYLLEFLKSAGWAVSAGAPPHR